MPTDVECESVSKRSPVDLKIFTMSCLARAKSWHRNMAVRLTDGRMQARLKRVAVCAALLCQD